MAAPHEELRDLALDVARAAARLAADLRAAPLDIDTKSTQTDMVTNADRAVEALVVERISEARPDDGFLGEEGHDRHPDAEVVWVVDPIDGTTNFVYDHPGWAVSIAARAGGIDGHDVAGVVIDVRRGDEFTATAGGGASRNGEPVRLGPDPRPLAQSLVATGFGYDAARRRQQAEALVDVIPAIRDIRRMGAASVDLCSVGIGRVDAYYETGLAAWDLAAGALFATECGARVADISGGPPVPGGLVVATHPERWDELAALLAATGL